MYNKLLFSFNNILVQILSVVLCLGLLQTVNAQEFSELLCLGQGDDTLLPNPNNTSSYYYCFNEVATLENCAENSIFVIEKQECLLQFDIETTSSDNEATSTPMLGSSSFTTYMPIEVPSTPALTNLSQSYDCPCYDTVLPTYLISEESCNTYYMCYRGQPLKMSCCGGHHWSPELGYCVPEHQSNCRVLLK